MGMWGDIFSREILDDIPFKERFELMEAVFSGFISHTSNPIAHGSSSEYLESILEKGLGAVNPIGAFAPEEISVCSLTSNDGLLAAYIFALRMGALFKSELSINARNHKGRSIIRRYTDTLGWGIKQRILLTIMALCYSSGRGKMKGWPILLIYDVKGEVGLEKRSNGIPSEFYALSPIPKELLCLILAPADKYIETQKIVSLFNLKTPILPLEIIELEEIYR